MDLTERENYEQSNLRNKLEAATEKATEAYKRLQAQTVAAAKATDRAVHEHPYKAIGIGFGLGLVIGLLVSRARRD